MLDAINSTSPWYEKISGAKTSLEHGEAGAGTRIQSVLPAGPEKGSNVANKSETSAAIINFRVWFVTVRNFWIYEQRKSGLVLDCALFPPNSTW